MGITPGLPPAGQPGPMRPDEFLSASVPNTATFSFEKLTPPSNIYVQRDDVLGIDYAGLGAGQTVNITVRLLLVAQTTTGQPSSKPLPVPVSGALGGNNIVTIQASIVGSTLPRTTIQAKIPLAEGYLLSVVASPGQSNDRGGDWVRAYLLRGPQTTLLQNAAYLLFADYTQFGKPIGWPGGRQLATTEGPGNLTSRVPTVPAAGADWTITVPTNARWLIHSLNAILTTSAAAGTRVPRVNITDGAFTVFQAAPQQGVGPGVTAQVSMTPGQITSVVDTTTLNIPLPAVPLVTSGDIISVITTGLAAADQWSQIRIRVEEWLIGV